MATGRVPTTANSPLTAKGDLFGYSTTQARVPVGNNGETLVADSSASTGLRWQGNFAAGKNKIINGDFSIWQRGTSFAAITSTSYTADRFRYIFDGTGVRTISRETFTPGTAPVAGYEGQYFYRINQTTAGTGGTFNRVQQYIEDVRTLAGQTVTVSYWAKSDATRTITPILVQDFFGSSSNVTTSGTAVATTTGWVRYSQTLTLPSLTGKTIGATSALRLDLEIPSNTLQTVDIWGVQVEAGNTATAFQTATGTLAGELAACQRYYVRFADSSAAYTPVASNYGYSDTTTLSYFYVQLPVSMRTKPASVGFANLRTFDFNAGAGYAVSAITVGTNSSPLVAETAVTHATATADRNMVLQGNNNTAAYLEYSAEL